MRALLKTHRGMRPTQQKHARVLLLVLTQACLLGQLCHGQLSLSLSQQSPAGAAPVLQWISGPAKASLGDVANIDVPKGYRFLEAKDARALLEQMKNPVPKDLEGILTPESGTWMVVFNYIKTGYFNVKSDAGDQIDAAEILKTIQNQVAKQNESRWRDNLRPIGGASWKVKPNYDSARHTLEWAIQAGGATDGVINHTVSLLGRSGVLNAIAVYPAHSALNPLKQLVSSVSFKTGQRYADYQGGDPAATVNLASLITDNKTANSEMSDNTPALDARSNDQSLSATTQSDKTPSVWQSKTLWISVGIIGVGGILLLKTSSSRRKAKHKIHTNGKQTRALSMPAVAKNGNGSAMTGSAVTTNGNGNGNGALASRRNGHHGQRRKRVFNYDKFYSEMVLSLSSPGVTETPVQNEYSPFTPSRLMELLSQGGAQNHSQTAGANSELIAMQKNLIEEQKRLIQEQAKLIQEKAKVIQEKNELIEKQIDLFGSKAF